MPARHPYLEHDGPIPFAHRGGAYNGLPENTLPSFRRALEMGYRYLETDVQATKDGVLLAFHDNDLSRTCGRPGKINELPWSEVRHARVDGTAPIPLLTDVLEDLPDARLNIDCKSWPAVEPLIAVLRRTDALHRVCLGSFSDRRLNALRGALGHELCSSMGPGEVVRWLLGRPPAVAMAAQVPVKGGPVGVVTERTIALARRADIAVHVWTIDEPDEMNRLLDLGVDGLMTDKPDVLQRVMQARGQWPQA